MASFSRLRAIALVALIGALLATLVVAFVQTSHERTVVRHLDGIVQRSADASTGEVEKFLAPLRELPQQATGLIDAEVLDAENDLQLEAFLFDAVQRNPEVDGMFLARPDGRFTYVSRVVEPGTDGSPAAAEYRLKTVPDLTGADREPSRLTWLNADGAVLDTTLDAEDDYDARTRPWYQAATDSGDAVWTEAYRFFSSGRVGVTAASPLTTPGGDLRVVVGVDVRLDVLTNFLERVRPSENASMAISTTSGDIVALAGGGTKPDLPVPVDEVGRPALSSAFAQEPGSILGVTANDTPQRVTRVLLDEPAGWSVAVAVPEADFVGELRANNSLVTMVLLALAAIAMVVLLPLLYRLSGKLVGWERSASTDSLTGLLSRERIETAVDEAISTAMADQSPMCIAMIDLDRFKEVNDTLGHQAGDDVLVEVARRLTNGLRAADSLGRLGGDEFLVVLPDIGPDDARSILERVSHAIGNDPVLTREGPVEVGASVGLVELGSTQCSAEAMLKSADQAMFNAKRQPRNTVVVALDPVERF